MMIESWLRRLLDIVGLSWTGRVLIMCLLSCGFPSYYSARMALGTRGGGSDRGELGSGTPERGVCSVCGVRTVISTAGLVHGQLACELVDQLVAKNCLAEGRCCALLISCCWAARRRPTLLLSSSAAQGPLPCFLFVFMTRGGSEGE